MTLIDAACCRVVGFLTDLSLALQIEVSADARMVATRVMADVFHTTVIFSGRVQGVGFRYTTLQVAKEFDVSGSVCNLPDGRVQLEAEGSAEEVKAFVGALQERMHGYIRSVEEKGEWRVPTLKGFTIK